MSLATPMRVTPVRPILGPSAAQQSGKIKGLDLSSFNTGWAKGMLAFYQICHTPRFCGESACKGQMPQWW